VLKKTLATGAVVLASAGVLLSAAPAAAYAGAGERGGAFRGRYHVLGGVLSAIEGVTPEALRIPVVSGKVSLYNRPYSVGLRWAGRTIWVGFDPEQGAWTFQDERGYEIRCQAADQLSAERIRALEVTHRRRGCHAAKPHEQSRAAQPTEQ
jgi:hypothetical protein